MFALANVKAHLRVRHAHEDAYIEGLVAAAVQAFNDQTNRLLIEPDTQLPDPVGNALHPTKAIEQGVLLLVGHWYVNREDVALGATATELPQSTRFLWQPYRWINI